MKYAYILPFIALFLFVGCSRSPQILPLSVPEPNLIKSNFSDLPNWEKEDYFAVVSLFIENCKSGKTKKIYGELCTKAPLASDAKLFLMDEFTPYRISTQSSEKNGLLTGYYEPQLRGSLTKEEPYLYPIYEAPADMLTIDLAEQYPELKGYRLRGRVVGSKVVSYYQREDVQKADAQNIPLLDSKIICYVDSKVDLFFLEIQGSGRVLLDSGETIFVGYSDQNGYKYSAIGKYLVDAGEISSEKISLQSIKEWLRLNPNRVDEVLNFNKSMVFFKQKKNPATGALGLILTPSRSVAVDPKYIPLGSMLYLQAKTNKTILNRVVMAQDTGGAIKGRARADLFLGYGAEAEAEAGDLKAPLGLWIFLPKSSKEESK
ncbi:MltA domain-containing protein [Sulfurimonas sp.]|uniref:murein transglycosylase A n=1 Tax=Sulfurimonas sp. TaxID=2022749 RepID=UPI0025F9B702|nr:MltA domain-containing protein [Sulfurimonas sp.]MDD5157220.1 MltA domain-containing protein [Sulfurimonas sp.]